VGGSAIGGKRNSLDWASLQIKDLPMYSATRRMTRNRIHLACRTGGANLLYQPAGGVGVVCTGCERLRAATLRRSTVVREWSTIGIRGLIGLVTVQLSTP